MAHIEARRQAVKLRSRGETYRSIRQQLGVAKSTLSLWLKDIELTPQQLRRIGKSTIEKRVESYRKTVRIRREKIFQGYIEAEKKIILPLSKRDLFIAGLFLYLGEGGKSGWWNANISNSNPDIIRFAIRWFVKSLRVPKARIRIFLQIYQDMNQRQEVLYWMKITGLPREQFYNPNIKKTSSQKIDHHSFGHGTCQISISDTKIKSRILAGMKIVLEAVNQGV